MRTESASKSALGVLVVVMLGSSTLLACSAQLDANAVDADEGELGVVSSALSVCEETVPADRNIDGIPAYAQCDASMTTAIFSNDGVSTSITQMGPDWVKTQYSGGYQCTELAHRYLYFRWDIDWVPRGNAGTWCDTVPPDTVGIVQTMAPVHGDIMVLAPGSCGAGATTGHVNLIDVVKTDGTVIAVEQNGARRGTYKQSCGKCFLHVVANDGTPGTVPSNPAGTAGAAAPMMGTAGSAAPPVTTPPATPPVTPPAPVNMMPAAPIAGSAAPVPAAPVPVPAPMQAPVAAPAPVVVPPAVPAYVPPARSDAAAADDSGCAVRAPSGSRSSGGSHGSHAWLALGWVALALSVLRRRR